MQIWVPVNEADIGSIHSGQPVSFTIDAHPGETYQGKVGKIRLNASMTQNVVNYTVEVITDNSSGRLLPYLTANVHFEVKRRDDVLTVPNAALRWTPTPDQIAPEYRDTAGNNAAPGTRPDGQGNRSSAQPENETALYKPGLIWAQAENGVRPIRVLSGLSDGTVTEIRGRDLQEGMQVVLGPGSAAQPAPRANDNGSTNTNPFTPQLRGNRGRAGR
jgi:HlyD family secretion protein